VRPDVFVTYVNLVEDAAADAAVNGVLFPIDPGELAAMDERERNYVRLEVTDRMQVAVGERVWTYVGSDGARERYERGRRRGAAVVSVEYVELVRRCFSALGTGELERFEGSTDPPEVPTRALRRVDLPRPA